MTMSQVDRFNAALNMIQVSPSDINNLTADMILQVCKVIAEAEKQNEEPSTYDGLTVAQQVERMTGHQ